MTEVVTTLPSAEHLSISERFPDFGQEPALYERPPLLRDVLGNQLFQELVAHEKEDGFRIVTRIPHPSLGAEGLKQLYEEDIILTLGDLANQEASSTLLQALTSVETREEGAKYRRVPAEEISDPKRFAFEQFLRHTSVQPTYRYEKERDPTLSLDEFARRFLRDAVRPAPTNTGTQTGLPTEGLVVTTGDNRFSPGKPETIEIATIVVNEQTGQRKIVFKEIALEDDLAEIELASFFYWDAEPTIEALLDMGEFESVIRVLDSYAYYCEYRGGNILNWNNTSVDRSQPPMFFRMVEKAAEYMGDEILVRYLRPMIQHFNFWRDGMDGKLGEEPGSSYRRTARLPDGETALRNFDDLHDHTRPDNPINKCCPRQEMHEQDLRDLEEFETLLGRKLTDEERCDFFLGIKAAAETGLDFTDDQAEIWEFVISKDGKTKIELAENIKTMQDIANRMAKRAYARLITHRLINPALNAMYAEGALIIAKAWKAAAKQDPRLTEHAKAQIELYKNEHARIWEILQKYCYNKEDKMFGMYDFVKAAEQKDADAGRRPAGSLNGIFVLSSGMTDNATAMEVLECVDKNFLQKGGLIAASRYFDSDKQWDGKASWPILVRECIKAAIRYERYDLAYKWLKIHLKSNEMLYAETGHLSEKNDASQMGKAIIVGEYGPQDIAMTYSSHLWMRKMLPHVRRVRILHAAGASLTKIMAWMFFFMRPSTEAKDDSVPSSDGQVPTQRRKQRRTTRA